MLAAALLWIVLPLLRPAVGADAGATRREGMLVSTITVLAVAALAAGLYAHLSNWDWNASDTQASRTAEVDKLLEQLEQKLKTNPQDVNGWLLLGRSYTSTAQYARSLDAYQHAYDLTQGKNAEALIGLGEALTLIDQASLQGRAGELFNRALQLAPNHPKALWYGSMAALQAGDLRTGRDRLQLLLAENPPEQLRAVLERQVQDLTEQLGDRPGTGGQGASPEAATPATAQRSIHVAVTLAPALASRAAGMTLFVLARDPQAPGPPLAVQRHSASELPLTISLSERDAMMPSRTIAKVPRVQVVARLSHSGTPQAQSGDFYGQADYDFANASSTLQIVIDQTVP